MTSPNPLRSITLRLNSTPVEDLPRYVGYLASSISQCADTLRDAETQKGDASVLVHKLKTRVSSLVQDKTSEGRFAGIVLVKAIVEAGGPQTLASSGAWVRSLLSCLNKQDPVEVKKLCLLTITRIYLLTKDHPSLVRDVTTPTLPSFISTSLGLIRPLATVKDVAERDVQSPLLKPVLQCWLQLIHHFPSTYRPFVTSLRAIILKLISDEATAEPIRLVASDFLIALHSTAPKNTASTQWSQTCQQIIRASHQASSIVFRSILEEWTPADTTKISQIGVKSSDELGATSDDEIGMSGWIGMAAGCSRIVCLLDLLRAAMTGRHAQVVTLPIASVIDLTARLSSVVAPNTQYSLRPNQEIGRDEREELWINLPRLHTATVELLGAMVSTFGQVLRPVLQIMFSQLCDMYESKSIDSTLKTASYVALNSFLRQGRVNLTSNNSASLAMFARDCCGSLKLGLRRSEGQAQLNGQDKSGKAAMFNLDSKQSSSYQAVEWKTVQSDLHVSAWDLLPLLFAHASILSSSIRAEMDGTAILIGHKEAMLASVMHSAVARKGTRSAPSILPFLAHADGESLGFEALVRPRMPIIRQPTGGDTTEQFVEDFEASEDYQPISTVSDLDVNMSEDANGAVAPVQPLEDSILSRKRDFADIETAASVDETIVSDSIKRPRSDIPQSASDVALSSASALESVDQGGQQQTTPINIAPELNIVQNVDVTSTADAGGQSTDHHKQEAKESGRQNTTVNSKKVVTDVSDSDDEEIPTIDATLTSEDEDEVSEDEEMEEI